MHLSIGCPTPYTPDKVRQIWAIAQLIKSDLHVRHFTEDVSH